METLLWSGASGALVGRDHAVLHGSRQDAALVVAHGQACVGVVSDGCGSARGSEAAAHLTARVAVHEATAAVRAGSAPAEVPARVLGAVVGALASLAAQAGPDIGWLHATLLGFVAVAEDVVLFSVGDGFLLAGEELIDLRGGPACVYPAHALAGKAPDLCVLRRPGVDRVAVATDGFEPESVRLVSRRPGRDLSRHLVLLQRGGAFSDDGAIAVGRRLGGAP